MSLDELKDQLMSLSIENTYSSQIIVYATETAEEVEARARRALNRGATVRWNDGSTQWVTKDPIWDSKEDTFIWHGDGDRIRTETWLHTEKNGEETRELLRTTWMGYESVMG